MRLFLLNFKGFIIENLLRHFNAFPFFMAGCRPEQRELGHRATETQRKSCLRVQSETELTAKTLRARQKIRCAFWRERRAGRCKAPRRRRCGGIVEERQRRRCPPTAAPLRAAARSKMYTLFPDGP
ncbi:MAG: hypothetical protein DMG10_07605 [Acidobacteria bacterium]|nr:MAG: hypothetical protein DMG10_07605 [Acidobacteriota bacterium]